MDLPKTDSPKKKIAFLTSGGDSPGMNAVLRAVVRTGINKGCDVYCVHKGYQGLVDGDIRKTGWSDVRGYLSQGGTKIKSARCDDFRRRDGRRRAAKNMILNGIDALIICGGDGSLTGADLFRSEWPSLLEELVSSSELTAEQIAPFKHLNIVGIVGSIDNDFSGTDATVGGYSALEQICRMVGDVQMTAESHSRAFVVEVMGRHCGWLALMSAVAVGADFLFIPERPGKENWKEDMCKTVKKHLSEEKEHITVIIAEGAKDVNGRAISANEVKDLLGDRKGLALDTRVTVLGHVQRGGRAVAYDRILGTLQGAEAVDAVLEATPETETCFIAITENEIVRKPLMAAVKETQRVAKAIEAHDFDTAMSLRDAEFADQYKSFMMTTMAGLDEDLTLPQDKRMKIGFINVGAPAGGMNAAVRAGVAYCRTRGHEPLAIHNGFAGFARHFDDKPDGAVRQFKWHDVNSWACLGGSEIGTNRELPEESGIETIAKLIGKSGFDALFLVGGFEAFHSVSQLRKARDKFPELCIPITLLPATISNNVPGTEYSLGSNTCLNYLTFYGDVVKQSAAASRRRLFIVKTMGGRCGYIAAMAGVSIGASAVYIPEEGISLDMIQSDVKHVKEVFQNDKGQNRSGRLWLFNEKASDNWDASMIARIAREEAHGRFEVRESDSGYFQQGLEPSGMDRCRAVRLAIRCIQHLEKFGPKGYERPEEIKNDPLSTSIIGIKGAAVVFSAMKQVEEEETDWKNRRPKSAHWLGIHEMCNKLGGRPEYPIPQRNLEGLKAKDVKRGLTDA